MGGTKEGGKRAAQTNKKRYGEDFFKRIGTEGGKKGTTGGFHVNPELAAVVGRKGGRKSKVGYKYMYEENGESVYYHTESGIVERFPSINLNEPVKIDHDKLDRMVEDE